MIPNNYGEEMNAERNLRQKGGGMSVASLENSKRLYELSKWDGVLNWYTDEAQMNWKNSPYGKSICPMYDAGYLLRKLPGIELYDVINLWEARSSGFNQVADTPEDALALLAIKLIEEKVITV